ncbi:plasmolipin [Spea bombifrons]|uniref:plasmolipin n=1 Tax=Spea bombifrons TaxID=233779 RepID=UPI002348F565|nr:plasmolipin [Spea bombifrons]
MSEFPSKVSTQTSTPEASTSSHRVMGFVSPDVGFLKSIPGILMLVQICLGLLVWALIADAHYHPFAAYGWVMFVAVFCWLVTLILYVIFLLQLHHKMPFIPWPLLMLVYHVAATVLYITGFITCAASVKSTSWYLPADYNKKAAASFFACLVMISYGASSFFSFTAWRGTGSNAATAQA